MSTSWWKKAAWHSHFSKPLMCSCIIQFFRSSSSPTTPSYLSFSSSLSSSNSPILLFNFPSESKQRTFHVANLFLSSSQPSFSFFHAALFSSNLSTFPYNSFTFSRPPSFTSRRYKDPTRRLSIKALLPNSTIVLTICFAFIPSIEFIMVSERLITISFLTDISGKSIKPDSGPFTPLADPAPLADPTPSRVALTFFTSFPLPGRGGNSAFLFVPPCTCTSTTDSCRLGTSFFPAALALAAISFLNDWKSAKFFFPDCAKCPTITY